MMMQQDRCRSGSPRNSPSRLNPVEPKMTSDRRRRSDILICPSKQEGDTKGKGKGKSKSNPRKKKGVIDVKRVSERSIVTEVILEEEELGECSQDGSASTDPSTTSSYQELTVTTITPKEDKTKLGLYLKNKELETENTRLFSVVLECVQEMERMESNLQQSKPSIGTKKNDSHEKNETKLLQKKLLSLIEAKHDSIQSSKKKEETHNSEEIERLRADLNKALARQEELESRLKDYKKVAAKATTLPISVEQIPSINHTASSPNSKKSKGCRIAKSSVLPSVVPSIVETPAPAHTRTQHQHHHHHNNNTVESLRAETELTIVASNLQRQLDAKTEEVDLTFQLVEEKEKKLVAMEYELEKVKTDLAWSERRRKELNALLEIKEEMTSMGFSNNTSSLSFSPLVKSALRKMPSKDSADTTTIGDDSSPTSVTEEEEEEDAVEEKVYPRPILSGAPTKSAPKKTNTAEMPNKMSPQVAAATQPPKPKSRYQLTHKFFNFPSPYQEQGPGSVVGLVITTRQKVPPPETAAAAVKNSDEDQLPVDDPKEGEKVRAAILNSAAFEREIEKFYQDEMPCIEDQFVAEFE
mmetsp:Transcript_26846/g.37845  ORF Transcript_26846/g.37845 Transcript_26846/m.37845 type:complete len:583 (+) Transcript_26846:117-1865(+)